ncbi:MAG: glutamate--tRNA ligase [Gemmatimonadetes bacterium]|nr:MAG: glutamate--tRNA ligase [Gemmatimonadota bacterium]PYO85323.1 MAG: glutamate--tRNA ligase [Gemmatimonadota bacterium]
MSRWLAMHPPARETKRPPAQPPPALVRAPDAADTSAAMTDRVRFAPSPTGYLHVGGARTALFNWLYARRTGGTFLLRIEDTDKQRSTDEHTQVILDGLKWLGLDWDEQLTFQGARLVRHQEVADKLLAEGKAYLEEGVIRLRVPPGEIAWDDAVHGRISFQGEDIKDFVILRSDRSPLYNFAVVVDDLDMRITLVLRGDDHISNTPKQLAVYHALGVPPPRFGHVPMINGPDGKKLSKRHGATAVGDYQHLGILPAALRNFLALLGWSPGGDKEIMTLDEMIRLFSLESILKKPAVFDMTKLEWMNGQYLSMASAQDLYPLVAPQLEKLGLNGNQEAVFKAIAAVKTRSRTTLDVARQVAVRLEAKFVEVDDKAKREIAKDPAGHVAALQAALEVLKDADWKPEILERVLRELAERRGVASGKIFQPIRIALTGGTVSEPVNELLYVVGKDAALKRLADAATGSP